MRERGKTFDDQRVVDRYLRRFGSYHVFPCTNAAVSGCSSGKKKKGKTGTTSLQVVSSAYPALSILLPFTLTVKRNKEKEIREKVHVLTSRHAIAHSRSGTVRNPKP